MRGWGIGQVQPAVASGAKYQRIGLSSQSKLQTVVFNNSMEAEEVYQSAEAIWTLCASIDPAYSIQQADRAKVVKTCRVLAFTLELTISKVGPSLWRKAAFACSSKAAQDVPFILCTGRSVTKSPRPLRNLLLAYCNHVDGYRIELDIVSSRLWFAIPPQQGEYVTYA